MPSEIYGKLKLAYLGVISSWGFPVSHIFSRITVEKRRLRCDQWDLSHDHLETFPVLHLLSCHMVELLSISYWEVPSCPTRWILGCFFCSFLQLWLYNQPPPPKEPPPQKYGLCWSGLMKTILFPLMLGRLWNPYFWGRLTRHGFNGATTQAAISAAPCHLAGKPMATPPKSNMTLDGKSTMNEWRCISYWREGFSNVSHVSVERSKGSHL